MSQAQKKDTAHAWVIGATIAVSEKDARRAKKYGSYQAAEGTHVEALDVYCSGCRKQMSPALREEPCSAKVDNRHLIGGDQRFRAKRKAIELRPGMVLLPGPRAERTGIAAVLNGTA